MPFQPFIIDRKRNDKGLAIFGWDPELPITLALIPGTTCTARSGGSKPICPLNTSCTP